MSGPVSTDPTCGAFRRLRPESLQDGRIHRFVVSDDSRVRVLDADEAARELEFGAQLADRVVIRLTALVRPADHRPQRQPCIG